MGAPMTSHPSLGQPYKVVVGIDYSDTSTLALHEALTLAVRRPDAQVYTLAVGEGLLSRPEDIVEDAQRAFREQAQKTLETHLADQLELLEKSGVRINRMRVGAAVDFGSPSERILALAEELGADLIVIGTHGRKGIQRLMVGSVAENVLRHAHCAVLVVRHKHHGEG
jgi:nucleotide-binding universal stress UspA family protein